MIHLKNILSFVCFASLSSLCLAQSALYNAGNMQMHNGAQIGFHTNVINDGILNNFVGFAGFYADTELRVLSGSNSVTFFDVEIDALNNLELQNSLGVRNQLSFINGQVITPRNNSAISLDFIDHDFYAGEDDERHVDGYSSVVQGANSFTFPIGDGSLLRPMKIPLKNRFDFYKGAYFYEDPNTPNNFATQFLTDQKQVLLENISNIEFWDLDGKNETRITLTWNDRSDISAITNNISLLTVVGWSKTNNQWENLNVTEVSGNLDNGEITSAVFVPDAYEVITIGALVNNEVNETNSDNIIISPNGDNLNETLVFEEIPDYDYNNLVIFNRWGNEVYKTENYKNNWNGISEGRANIKELDKLPVGTYFYILNLGENSKKLQKTQKGWVYITR